MNFINFKLKYAEELSKEKHINCNDFSISFKMEKLGFERMKNAYREMGEFNQQYSEMGLSEDLKNLLVYEKNVFEDKEDES